MVEQVGVGVCGTCFRCSGCSWADDLKHQAINGNTSDHRAVPLDKENMVGFMSKIETTIKPECQRPEVLQDAESAVCGQYGISESEYAISH